MPKFTLNGLTGQFDLVGGGSSLSTGTVIAGANPNSVLVTDGTSSLQDVGSLTNGQIVIGSTGVKPVAGSLTGTTNQVIVTSGAGTLGLSLPQDIATSSSPTFNTVHSDLDKSGVLSIGTSSATTVNIGSNTSGASVLGALNLNSHLINNVLNPVSAQDAATKNYTDTSISALSSVYIPLTQKAAALGVATLDGSGKLPISQLPIDAMELKGFWDASTNIPTLADGTGSPGDIWEANVAGTTNFGSGSIVFAIGDWAVYAADNKWHKSINSNAVTSVNGLTGTVVLITTNVAEGTNLYFTNARAQASVTGAASTIVTSNLTTNRALLSDGSGKVAVSSVTNTELGYVSGVTSSIQTQLNSISGSAITSLTGDVTGTGPGAAATTLASVGTAGTYGAVTTDVKGRVISGTIITPIANGGTNSSTALNNNRIVISNSGAIVESAAITGSKALVSNASGIPIASTTTDTEIGYLSGVTSAIQTQFTNKANVTLNNLGTTAFNADLIPDNDAFRNIGTNTKRIQNIFTTNVSGGPSLPNLALSAGIMQDSSASDSIDFGTRKLKSASIIKLDWSGTDVSLNTRKLINIVDPTSAQDAATKNYVDTSISAVPVTTAVKQVTTLSSTDITNQYVDLANVSVANSIVFSRLGVVQRQGFDYSVSLTGGAGGKTRVSFTAGGDLASSGGYPLVAGDIIEIQYYTGANFGTGAVTSVNGYTGAVVLAASDVGAAPLTSPGLLGNPTAPTQSPLNNSTRIATTAYVDAAVAAGGGSSGVSSFNARTGTVTLTTTDVDTVYLTTSIVNALIFG